MLRICQQALQEILIVPEHIWRKIRFPVHAVFDAVEALLRAQIKKIVNADAEDLRQQRQRGDVRHGHRVFPFGHRLGADPQLFRQLLLGQARFEAKLFDLLSQIHLHDLLSSDCSFIIMEASQRMQSPRFPPDSPIG